MIYRKNIEIKTKYKFVQECIEKCRDYKGKTLLTGSFMKGISGIVNADGSFELSSRNKYGNLFKFIGIIEKRDDGIYMVGEIRPKNIAKYTSYFGVIFGLMIGIFLIISFYQKNQPILFGYIFILFPWINIFILKNSNSLYKLLIKKVK